MAGLTTFYTVYSIECSITLLFTFCTLVYVSMRAKVCLHLRWILVILILIVTGYTNEVILAILNLVSLNSRVNLPIIVGLFVTGSLGGA